MSTQEALIAARSAIFVANNHPEVQQQMYENPMDFFSEVFCALEIPLPEGFHVHILEDGLTLPDEPGLEDATRNIYIVNSDNSVEQKVIPPQKNPPVTASSGNCNFCRTCIVVITKTGLA